jgi:hypothetical protein
VQSEGAFDGIVTNYEHGQDDEHDNRHRLSRFRRTMWENPSSPTISNTLHLLSLSSLEMKDGHSILGERTFPRDIFIQKQEGSEP